MTDLTVIDPHAEHSEAIRDPHAIAAQARPIADARFTAAAVTRGRR